MTRVPKRIEDAALPDAEAPPNSDSFGPCSAKLVTIHAIALSSSCGVGDGGVRGPISAVFPFSCNGFDPNYNRQNCLKVEFTKALRATNTRRDGCFSIVAGCRALSENVHRHPLMKGY